mgnify:CR=1 FL=1
MHNIQNFKRVNIQITINGTLIYNISKQNPLQFDPSTRVLSCNKVLHYLKCAHFMYVQQYFELIAKKIY